MPVVQIQSPLQEPPEGLIDAVAALVAEALGLSPERAWVMWHPVPSGFTSRPEWRAGGVGPVVTVICKSSHRTDLVEQMIVGMQQQLASWLACDPADVYIAVLPVTGRHLLVRGELWDDRTTGDETSIVVDAVGWVRSPRKDLEDDHWGSVESVIELDPDFGADAIVGIADFSHAEIVFHLHRVPVETIVRGARRPRGNAEWDPVGIFAQRAKARPNRIGVSRARILGVDGLAIRLQGLDAIDGTPVLDIKPWLDEFGPLGETHQPLWSRTIMSDYYSD